LAILLSDCLQHVCPLGRLADSVTRLAEISPFWEKKSEINLSTDLFFYTFCPIFTYLKNEFMVGS
jgi:hypothetical protein